MGGRLPLMAGRTRAVEGWLCAIYLVEAWVFTAGTACIEGFERQRGAAAGEGERKLREKRQDTRALRFRHNRACPGELPACRQSQEHPRLPRRSTTKTWHSPTTTMDVWYTAIIWRCPITHVFLFQMQCMRVVVVVVVVVVAAFNCRFCYWPLHTNTATA